MLTGAKTPDVSNTSTGLGRIQRVTSAHGRTILTIDGPDGVRDLVLPITPDRAGGVAAAAGLWRLQWVRLHVDAPAPIAHLAGTTRHPHVRSIPLSAALALAEQGVPAFVCGEGD